MFVSLRGCGKRGWTGLSICIRTSFASLMSMSTSCCLCSWWTLEHKWQWHLKDLHQVKITAAAAQQTRKHTKCVVFKSMYTYIDLNQWNNAFYFLINWLTVEMSISTTYGSLFMPQKKITDFLFASFFSVLQEKRSEFWGKSGSYLFFNAASMPLGDNLNTA